MLADFDRLLRPALNNKPMMITSCSGKVVAGSEGAIASSPLRREP
jgi:hypothetical protein